MKLKLIYNFASRSRPEKFFKCLDNIIENAEHTDYLIVCSLDLDDDTMMDNSVLDKMVFYYSKRVVFKYSLNANKIAAINCHMPAICNVHWDILLNHSDDMWFTKKGFDLDIIAAMEQHFKDGDGLLHFPDGHANERLVTYSIMGRKYYERFGYIYHPAYSSLFCDNEQMEVAQRLGKYAYVDQHLLEHRHPAWGLAETDDQYRKTEAFYEQDKAIYESRKAANFYL